MSSAHLNSELKEVLETLGQEPLSDSETEQVLQDAIKALKTPSITYRKNIDFNDLESIQEDMMAAREMIMETIDKSKKVSDLVFEALAVDLANVTYLTLAQESNKTIQQSVKTLTALHADYHKIIGQKKRNDIVDNQKEETEEVVGDEGSFESPRNDEED